MEILILERDGMNDFPWPVTGCVALPKTGLIKAIDPGDAPFQIRAVTFTALIGILAIGGAMLCQPGSGMLCIAA
jgi:hypothetical protein